MRLLRAMFLPLSVVTLVAAAVVVPLPLYLEEPGRSLSLADCVDVDAGDSGAVAGDYLLTTVNLLRATTVDAVRGVVDDDIAVLGQRDVIPPGQEVPTFFAEQADVFATTADIAAAVGLEAAGLEADVQGEGVLVVRTIPETPAHGVLAAGDVIIAAAGRPVDVDADLRAAVAAAPPDQPVRVVFVREGARRQVDITPVDFQGARIIGVEPQTFHQRVDLPVPVSVASGSIGGPSAGLMIALTVYDTVADDDLAAGRRVAGTGTIDLEGNVGPVGGVALKVLAAGDAGADVFLAPAGQLAQARSGLRPDSRMQVLGVSDFQAARQVLLDTAGDAAPAAPAERAACPFAATGAWDAHQTPGGFRATTPFGRQA